MIGFRPNGEEGKDAEVESEDKAGEVNFEALWDELLDLSSPEVRDAYSSYDHKRRN